MLIYDLNTRQVNGNDNDNEHGSKRSSSSGSFGSDSCGIFSKKIQIDGHSSCVPERCTYFLYFGLTNNYRYQ